MDWTELEWAAPGTDHDPLAPFLIAHGPLIRSALEEAAAGVVLGPVTIVGAHSALCTAGELPAGFIPLASFELLGTSRRAVGVALDPAFGTELGGASIGVENIARGLLEAFDEVLVALVGEGLSLGPSDRLPDDEVLLLLRLSLASEADPTDAPDVAVVAVMALAARAELATHISALETLGTSSAGETATDVRGPAPGADSAAGPASEHVASARPLGPGGSMGAPSDGQPSHVGGLGSPIRPAQFPPLFPAAAATGRQSMDLLLGVNLEVSVEIGRARMMIRDVLSLTPGSIVELDKLAGEKVDVLVNRHHVATGEVVVVDENFGVRITEIVARDRRLTPFEGRA